MSIFDTLIDRKHTGSVKWDQRLKNFGREDILPMWVADMDFPSPPEVAAAIKRRADHPVFGYTEVSDGLNEAIIQWLKRRKHWQISKEWIVHSPGVVTSLIMAILAFTEAGDKILIQSPVYHPFYPIVTSHSRELVINPLTYQGETYGIDFDDLQNKLRQGVKMMLLCSPHNPVGRVWTVTELTQIAGLCQKYQVLLVSDEIHADLVLHGNQHFPVAAVCEELLPNSITCISPTKTFNLAGLAESVALIPNTDLRAKFQQTLLKSGAGMLNIFGLTAAEAAYTHGEPWLEELMIYLSRNLEILLDYFNNNIPQIKVIKPQGTYLAWLNCRELGIEAGKMKDFFVQQARVGLNEGSTFGTDGVGFQRINFACPRSLLIEGLKRIESAVKLIKS